MLYMNGVAITSCSLFEKHFSPEAVIMQKKQVADFVEKLYALLSASQEIFSTFFNSLCQATVPEYRITNEINYLDLCNRLHRFKTKNTEYSSSSNDFKELCRSEKFSALFRAISEVVKQTDLNDNKKQTLLCLLVTAYIIADKTFEQCPTDAQRAEKAFRISEKLINSQELNEDEKDFFKENVYSNKKEGKLLPMPSEKEHTEKKDNSADDGEKSMISVLEATDNRYSYNGGAYKFLLSENAVFGENDRILLKKITAEATALGVHEPIDIEFYNKNSAVPVYKETLQTGDYIYVSCLNDEMYYVHPKISVTEKNSVGRQGNTVIWEHNGQKEDFSVDVDVVSLAAEKVNEGFVLVLNEGAYYGLYSNVDVIGDCLLQENVVEVGFMKDEIYMLLNNGYVYNSLSRQVSKVKYIKLSDFIREVE